MKTDRSIDNLSDEFKPKVEGFINDSRIKEMGVFITEGLRTQKRQNYLYSLGRNRPGNIVTWTLNSRHLGGNAIDIACNKGQLYPRDINWWNTVYDIADEYGILSLYKNYGVDKPHLENNPSKPNKEYLQNNKETMDLAKEFEENQLKLVILANGNMRKSTNNAELKEKLAEMNVYLRSLED